MLGVKTLDACFQVVTRKRLESNAGLFSTAQAYILPAYYALRRIKGHYKLS